MIGSTLYLIRKGDIARGKKEWANAEAAYRAALARNPRIARIWVQLGHSLKEQGSIAAALAAYRQADLIQPERADTIFQIARMLHLLGAHDEALANYESALALDQSLGDGAYEVACAKKEWANAEAICRAALARNPRIARIWVQLGHSLKEQGSIADALAAYRQADLIQPGQADTIHQIARMLHLLGAHDEALAKYETVLALDQSLRDAAHEARWLRAWLNSRHNPRFAGLPKRLRYVILGTTGMCNASCVHCPTGKTETAHAPRVPMSMALFRKIVDGIADLGLPITDQVSFGLFGDALVDPLVVQRAAFLHARLPDARISVNTNGAAFNAKKHAALNDYVFTIALHCESLVPETYDDLMRPLRAERVFPKFEAILETFPGKVLVSVPVSKRNLEELPTIREWFLTRGAKEVAFDALSSRCAEDRSVFNSLALDPHPIRCPPEIMDDLIVDCDGQILACCQDFQRIEGIGSLQTESLADVLVGLRRSNLRKLLAEGRHEEMATCSRCYADLRF